jgi:hypothetical protein
VSGSDPAAAAKSNKQSPFPLQRENTLVWNLGRQKIAAARNTGCGDLFASAALLCAALFS